VSHPAAEDLMMRRPPALVVSLVLASSLPGLPVPLVAQSYTAPRTPDGQPDLRGVWTNETITPFERPRNMADKPFHPEAEAAAIERQSAERRDASDRNTAVFLCGRSGRRSATPTRRAFPTATSS
jgi:hypothetical protein